MHACERCVLDTSRCLRRFWCKLSSLSADGGPSPCMPVLVATFRMLLNEAEPGLEAQLHSVGFSPAHCAVRWMACGFVDVLDVEEVRLAGWKLLYRELRLLQYFELRMLLYRELRRGNSDVVAVAVVVVVVLAGGENAATSSLELVLAVCERASALCAC